MTDLDRSLNARAVAKFEGRSIVSINRDIRAGRFPPADYVIGQFRYWKLSTVIRARERRIGEAAARAGAQRQEQVEAAATAREARRRKRAAGSANKEAITQ